MEKTKRDITYHNKDVLSKILAENFKDKSLEIYGIHMPKICRILPTNLPEIQVNEMRIDNLFLLEDGSVAIIDYESTLKWENNLKYLNYIVRILERYKKREEILRKIRMIVIYTADVEAAPEEFSVGCITLKLEQAFLSRMESESIRKELAGKLEKGIPLSDDERMKLIVFPLTYKGAEQKKWAVKEAVKMAGQILDEEEKMFVLSGILVFADKIMDAATAKYIKEAIRMTQVEELWLEEGREEGRKFEREAGIKALVDALKSFAVPDEAIAEQLTKRYCLTPEETRRYLKSVF